MSGRSVNDSRTASLRTNSVNTPTNTNAATATHVIAIDSGLSLTAAASQLCYRETRPVKHRRTADQSAHRCTIRDTANRNIRPNKRLPTMVNISKVSMNRRSMIACGLVLERDHGCHFLEWHRKQFNRTDNEMSRLARGA
jgi:hypothetical protein